MILLNYLVFLGTVALVMACVAGLLITEKAIFESIMCVRVRAKKKFFCHVRMCVLAQRSTITALVI